MVEVIWTHPNENLTRLNAVFPKSAGIKLIEFGLEGPSFKKPCQCWITFSVKGGEELHADFTSHGIPSIEVLDDVFRKIAQVARAEVILNGSTSKQVMGMIGKGQL